MIFKQIRDLYNKLEQLFLLGISENARAPVALRIRASDW